MANLEMMRAFEARHGGKGAESKAELEARSKAVAKPKPRYAVTPKAKALPKPVTPSLIVTEARNAKHCPTCSCKEKVHATPAEKQRAYRARKGGGNVER